MFVKIYMNFHWEAQRARGEAASCNNIGITIMINRNR